MYINFNPNDIIHTDEIISELKVYLTENETKQIFIITDKNCLKLCYPLIKSIFPETQSVFSIETGEVYKTLETVTKIWDFLFEKRADRNSLIINIGGGIVSDIGGFSASTFKRGISFINIPTTLLAQVDASVGGKTGINYNGLKNQIGTLIMPDKVFISTEFLETLNSDEILSGFGEMIKHALIYNEKHFYELINYIKNEFSEKKIINLAPLINKSVNIKIHFVKNDVTENGMRMILNFGHTFGHAFESYFFSKNKSVKHGIAVIYGIICELWLSVKYLNFDKGKFTKITGELLDIYPRLVIPENEFNLIFGYMQYDKKNKNNTIQSVLLKDVEFPVIQRIIEENDVYESLRILNSLSKRK
ncbi:MAG: 3-dehydroquinate synthase [Bacteroidales bacterium]|nr:3-dehydroquinate synthase [Bacteroidales bacterium]